MTKQNKTSKAPGKPKVNRPKIQRGKTMMGDNADVVDIKPMHTGRLGVRESVVVAWGRMNPPTIGHQRLVERVREVATEQNADSLVFLAKALNESNPLTYAERVELAVEAFGGDVTVVEENVVTNPITLGKFLSEMYNHVTIITGDDQAADYQRIFNTYNGKEFTFESVDVQVLSRHGDSLNENISATQMREYVENGDLASFEQGLPPALRNKTSQIFERVKYGMDVQQKLNVKPSTLQEVARHTILKRRG